MIEPPAARVVLLVPFGLLTDHRREVVGVRLAAELPGVDVEIREVDELPEAGAA